MARVRKPTRPGADHGRIDGGDEDAKLSALEADLIGVHGRLVGQLEQVNSCLAGILELRRTRLSGVGA